MKKLSMILTVLVIFGSSAIGHTSDECVVFEGIFEKSTRRPVAHFEYFQALDGEAIVKVYNEPGGHHAERSVEQLFPSTERGLFVPGIFLKRNSSAFGIIEKRNLFVVRMLNNRTIT